MSKSRRAFDEDVALQAAIRVFWEHGFRNASMEMLCAAMGLRPQSVYLWMGDKRGLFLACLDYYATKYIPPPIVKMAKDGGEGLKSLSQLFDHWLEWANSQDFPGCVVTLGLSEFGATDPEILRALEGFEDTFRTGLQKALEKAKRDGDLDPTIEPRQAAAMIAMIRHGLMVEGRAGRSEGAAATIDFLRRALFDKGA